MFSQAALNASLNGLSAILLTCGYVTIRAGKIAVHKAFMGSVFLVSSTFLVSYLIYHCRLGQVIFYGLGSVRTFYLILLATHKILAVVIVPLILMTLWRAKKQNFAANKKIARWTWPLWMYVSVTGVVIYFLLYQIFPQH